KGDKRLSSPDFNRGRKAANFCESTNGALLPYRFSACHYGSRRGATEGISRAQRQSASIYHKAQDDATPGSV
ncbi:hypothetical protein, partial [Pyrinomonas sp.]|uniref:hypothetical protein n=1 Tax=Pyrinomonas sp. TaxID=2080306 RepID=UPI003327EAD6